MYIALHYVIKPNDRTISTIWMIRILDPIRRTDTLNLRSKYWFNRQEKHKILLFYYFIYLFIYLLLLTFYYYCLCYLLFYSFFILQWRNTAKRLAKIGILQKKMRLEVGGTLASRDNRRPVPARCTWTRLWFASIHNDKILPGLPSNPKPSKNWKQNLY